jgi:hypothetical protein
MTDKAHPRERRPYERCHTDRRFAEWLRAQGLAEEEGGPPLPVAPFGNERVR